MKKKINFQILGRGNNWQHFDTITCFKGIFIELGYEVFTEDKPRLDSLNILFEGFSSFGKERNKLETYLKNKKYEFIIIGAENLVKINYFKSYFYSYNSYDFYSDNLIKKNIFFKVISFLYFYKLTCFFFVSYQKTLREEIIYNKFKKKHLYNYPFKNFFSVFYLIYNNLKKKKLFIFVFLFKKFIKWKKISYIFSKPIHAPNHYKNNSYFNRVFKIGSTIKYSFDRTEKGLDHINKCITFMHPFTDEIYYENKNINVLRLNMCSSNYAEKQYLINCDATKEYDFILTGRINEYRSSRIDLLKKKYPKIKILYLDLMSDNKKRFDLLSKSKFILGLMQHPKQTFLSPARSFSSLMSGIPLIAECSNLYINKVKEQHISKFIFLENEEIFCEKIGYYLDNYEKYKKLFFKNREKYFLSSKVEIEEFKKNFKIFL